MRYPKLAVINACEKLITDLSWDVIKKGSKAIIISYGADLTKIESLNLDCYLVNARFIRPIDKDLLNSLASLNLPILVYEQVVNSGSLGQMVEDYLVAINFEMKKFKKMNFDENKVVTHGNIEEVLKRYNLGEKDIISEYEKLCD